ncbi:MAG: BtrH N-terminal domain-containing protein [Proteobacteria bacterium]|nr:BtrH N-terminal domain-containing protein [Pseudomonadota bacterium]MBU1418975.1 BtrH N-terminal domain-containing protein [Pseudomonadota bacterium]MBU1455237.1 BtrH N-terminal domain-containing protein [Pseudomonadota bacterium]
MSKQEFAHGHAAHCESGVMSLMMQHHGLPLSEAMVFGLSGALMFAYLPFVKLGGLPLIAYRSMPKSIIKGLQKNLGIKMKMQTFSNPEKGTKALDALLVQGEIVGAQTSVFWLPYFPEEMRFHFNAHNLIIYGKKDDEYLISDPVFEAPVRCVTKAMQKARFVKGVMAPKGLLYYPLKVPETIDYAVVIPRAVKKNAKAMLKTPVPIAGIRGIRALAKSIGKLEKKDRRYAKLFLGHIVRMQEEIGTGGAGFRFIYASFLQEAGRLLGSSLLAESSEMMTAVGDQWREFALMLAKAIRSKKSHSIDFPALQIKLESVADAEAAVYRKLLEGKLV